MFKKAIIPIIVLIILAVLVLVFILSHPESLENSPDISILQEFQNKIVYTTNISEEREGYIKDCNNRFGDFNECGTVCANDSDICADVCAYTCEF